VNVADRDALVRVTVVGLNVPPPLLSLGVTVTGEASVPAPRVAVKLDEADPIGPVEGPMSVYKVTTPPDVVAEAVLENAELPAPLKALTR
jgi:hypothetical protein